jgi:fumarate reductase flavoprotein subunit
MQKLFDVTVVGGGGSGLATALRAAQNGASVIVFEKLPELGGTTGIAIGSFTANRTVYQRKEGIEDNQDNHEKDAGLFGPLEIQARNNRRMRRFFLEHSADSLDWLMEMECASTAQVLNRRISSHACTMSSLTQRPKLQYFRAGSLR